MGILTAVEDARTLRHEWDELAARNDASPFVRPGWLLAWHEAFGRFPLHAVTAREGGELSALLLLQGTRGFLSSPTNWHSPDFDVIGSDPVARSRVLQAALDAAPWRMTLSFVDDSVVAEVTAAAVTQRRRAASSVIESSPYIDAPASFEEYSASLHKKVVREMRRRRRKLEERGDLRLSVVQRADPTALGEFLAVEGSGWKTERGTALDQDPATRGFYESVARWADEEGWLRLMLLRLDDTVLAGDFAIHAGRTHYLLKTGYDPEYRSLGPGKILRWEVLTAAMHEGIDTYEFLGDANEWKSEWTVTSRRRHRVYVFGRGPRAVTSVEMPARRVARLGRERLRQWRER